MRVPLEWLHDHVRPPLTTDQLGERLAMTGTEVQRIHRHGVDNLDLFVVGRVLSAERHPDADRLTVCHVAVGEGDTATIVCGAPNVATGQTVAVARPGAIMPDGTKLGKAKLRGVPSEGMILAEDELGIGTAHDGIMVLDDLVPGGGDLVPGTPLADVLPLATDVLELEITPNRPDCLGIYGVAREAHAATDTPLGPPPWRDDPGADSRGTPPPGIEVTVADPRDCPRFTARIFEDVTIAESPPWLKARLMAAGQRPVNNVVDITNYVMLLTAHPLHAFDLDRVAGGRLNVRRAREGERLTTLDGVDRALDADMVVIEDADGPTSLAGVMGGERSEVHEDTTRVLLEVAVWDGPNINRTSTRLNLRSEASSRYEKGLSPESCMEAQAVATRLMLELTGARLVPGTVDVGGDGRVGGTPRPIRLRDARVAGVLGMPVERERSAAILRALEFGVADAQDGLDVTVPHFRRNDVTREADLIEEVARLGALEELPATVQENRTGRAGGLTAEQRLRRRTEDVLVGHGLHEIAGWSFTEPAVLDKLLLPADHPLRRVVRLENPMSEAQSILRPTLVGSLLDAAARNRARGAGGLGLFEVGAVYRADPAREDGLADEHTALGVLLAGRARPPSWRDAAPPPPADFFAAKGLLEAVLGTLRADWRVEPAQRPFLHPGRAASVHVDGRQVGFLGELHPRAAAAWDFDEPVAVFALDLGKILPPLAARVELHEDLTSFPSLRQDLAVVVDDAVPAQRVVDVVRTAGSPVLARADVFDVFRGEQLGAGRVSLALHLEFRAGDRTLTDEDVAPVRERVVAALRDEVGGELRG